MWFHHKVSCHLDQIIRISQLALIMQAIWINRLQMIDINHAVNTFWELQYNAWNTNVFL